MIICCVSLAFRSLPPCCSKTIFIFPVGYQNTNNPFWCLCKTHGCRILSDPVSAEETGLHSQGNVFLAFWGSVLFREDSPIQVRQIARAGPEDLRPLVVFSLGRLTSWTFFLGFAKILHKHCLPREIENNWLAKFWRENKEYYRVFWTQWAISESPHA